MLASRVMAPIVAIFFQVDHNRAIQVRSLSHVAELLSPMVDSKSSLDVRIISAFVCMTMRTDEVFLRTAGLGVLVLSAQFEIIYFHLFGAKIGRGVGIDRRAQLGEFDLITLHDGYRIDQALVRGFCFDRDGLQYLHQHDDLNNPWLLNSRKFGLRPSIL
ncbi:hypothetical protein E1B28_005423 [Marasmius oreades]|uniref:Uncharacterized protein n=1 Tax=Marasmius oreades TaxID=181124 RepID=A0A9P7S3P1_9AGAR|nr:uncharacterized protein E1B28_005423 [Marasmius oreades]KAG7094598.1 hypothetical protein E1B28_005423 [Marasmius oreades]